jgi:hypothetical protein
MQKPRKPRLFIVTISILIILLVLSFVEAINLAALDKNYTNSLTASYRIAGSEPVRKIEYALRYGKILTNFYGMKELLLETKNDFPEIQDIKIILPGGSIAYNITDQANDKVIPAKIAALAFDQPESTSGQTDDQGQYHVLLPIRDKGNLQIGALDIVLANQTIRDRINTYFRMIIQYTLIILLGSILLFLLSFYLIPVITKNRDFNFKIIIGILITILTLAQILLGLIHFNMNRNFYIEISRENTAKVVKVVQRDVNLVIGKGVPVTELYGIEEWLNAIVQSVPEIESLYITDMRGEVYYKTKNLTLMQEELIDPIYNYSLPLTKDYLDQKGLVNLVLSKSYMDAKLRDIVLDFHDGNHHGLVVHPRAPEDPGLPGCTGCPGSRGSPGCAGHPGSCSSPGSRDPGQPCPTG